MNPTTIIPALLIVGILVVFGAVVLGRRIDRHIESGASDLECVAPSDHIEVSVSITARGRHAESFIETYRLEEALVAGGIVPESAVVTYQALRDGVSVLVCYRQTAAAGVDSGNS